MSCCQDISATGALLCEPTTSINMAVSGKHDGIKQVPWLSPAEWHDVYRQIYSNDAVEQTKAYETLLTWKARMPKLPAGVDCTLSILQVCLRDREWTSKIDNGELPMYCENDLSLMYSTTIMRFLNYFSNIGQTKQTSMFKIANQLKIPEWIVELRHETAHGHELPSIGVLRVAINILLLWLHDEYWAPEAHAMEKCYLKKGEEVLEEEGESEVEDFTYMIEIWTTVSLYVTADYKLVSDLPDTQLREMLQDLRTYMLSEYRSKTSDNAENEYVSVYKRTIKMDKEYNLQAAKTLLLAKISIDLNKSSSTMYEKNNTICNALCKNKVFLPNSDILKIFRQKEKNINLKRKILPLKMLQFWKDIIFLLHKKHMLETLLFKLFNIVNQEHEDKERRNLAALWINSIFYSFVQLDIVQSISHTVEYHKADKKLDTKILSQHLKERIHSEHPYLRNVLWLDISSIIPHFLLDVNFLSKLLLNVNEFSARLVEPILKLFTSRIDTQTQKHLINLLQIYTCQKDDNKDSNNDFDKIFNVKDLDPSPIENEVHIQEIKHANRKKTTHSLADQIIRNSHWKLAHDNYQWIGCPIGLLPWQVDSLKSLEPLQLNPSKHPVSVLDSQIVAGIINRKNLKMQSCIKWDDVLRKKRRIERKCNKGVVDVMNRALEIVKNQK
ncbi:PREDICTED: ribosomal biogenesis protein LAS1L [Cyphomyrmex costatus]|uniref:ribosomal biogenesis protein LAS1L n=1 Tax=Cyphomyrmex costatus TaxID=456900 RepID=UPI000852288D|nr:PREDICTED: ribosomal biogenesis protein LAS1L [Cyphomyrmex costatus]